MRAFLRLTLAMLFLIQGSWTAQAGEDLTGVYVISRGINATDGSTYTGKVAIQHHKDNMYAIVWDEGVSSNNEGIGLAVDNLLCTGWSNNDDYGVTVYKVQGGRLYGTSISHGTNETPGTEVLEGPPELHGTYEIVSAHGSDDGVEYSGTVGIQKTGEVYQLRWWIGNYTYTGVGLLKGDLFIVGWSAGLLEGVNYYEIKGHELLGRWATSGTSATTAGVENLVRRN